jgi:pseudaminic acid biosynthesis-associated methylase
MPMSDFSTDQEDFWAGDFGNEYTERNAGPGVVASNVALFGQILGRTAKVDSVLELGANRGLNMLALRTLLPGAALTALEINARAVDVLRRIQGLEVVEGSILQWQPARRYDLVFTKGVLIHLAPERLPQVYDLMHAASSRYVLVAEYYAPTPAEVPYRGHSQRLFKRDFAGELMDRHSDLELVDHGFAWRRARFPQDDINWFLLEKRQRTD